MSTILISNVPGKIPTVNQLDRTDSGLGYNRADGLIYALRVVGSFKSVVAINGTNPPVIVPAGDFKGTATLVTNPGSPTSDEWWSATEVGVYTHFGNIVVSTMTEVFNYLKWTQATTSWSVETVNVHSETVIIPRIIELKVVSDILNPLVGDGKLIFCIPQELNGMILSRAHCYLTTSAVGVTTLQLRNITTTHDMLITRITIDSGELTSYTAAAAPVINPAYRQVFTGDLIAVDIDTVAEASKGLGVILTFNA